MSNQGSFQKKIVFEVGTRLEAQDFTLKWYPARICRIDQSGKKALIHFEGWNHRFDEWISFDSERLRASTRNAESKEDKGDKSVHSHEWKVGDRVLAKWVDGKFYPAKITKKNEDGVYEVLFYDGVKKNLPKMNLKPDNRKIQALPVSKETLTQQSERIQRKTLLANARAERARKRSKEQAENAPSVVQAGKRRERNKKPKIDSEPVVDQKSSKTSPSGSPVGKEKQKTLSVGDSDDKNIATSSQSTRDVNTKSLETNKDTNQEKTSDENTVIEKECVENTDQKEQTEDASVKEKKKKTELPTEKISGKKIPKSREKENENEKESFSMDTAEKSPNNITCTTERTSIEIKEERKKVEASESTINEPESTKDLEQSTAEETSLLETENKEDSTSKEAVDLTTEKTVRDVDSVSHESQAENMERKEDEGVELKENNEKVEQICVGKEPEVNDKPQESQQDKLNKGKSQEPQQDELDKGLALKSIEQQVENNNTSNVVQDEPKETENKVTAKKSTKVSPKTQKKGKGVQNGAGEKKRATRSRSAISPRGYGYSMAVMHPQVSKPEPASVEITAPTTNEVTESIDTIIDSLSEDTAIVELKRESSETNQDSTSSEVAGPQSKVKTKNFQAKKLRLDQITVKLSAQRQSEAEAAVQSPSAFQMTVQQSSSPPLKLTPPPPAALATPPPQKAPSPSASLPSHYPMENYNVPPPLIYAPMAAAGCSNPHCQQHGSVYPTPPRAQLHGGMSHPMHLAPSHLHPHSAGYVMYPPGHGPTYDTRPPISACSCAGCTGPVYHHLPPEANPHHESALARLMQVEQRILHPGPSPHMAHYRDGAPHHGTWLPHGHPHAPQYCPLPTKHEEMWRHERPPHQPKSPHVSPVPESEAAKIMRRWKNERSFPPVSSSSPDMLPARPDEIPDQSKLVPHVESLQRVSMTSIPKETKQQHQEKMLKENSKSKEASKEKSQPMNNQSKSSEGSVDQQYTATTSTSTTDSNVPSSTVTTPTYSQPVSLGGKTRKGKEPVVLAPKELVIDLDHNKYKCPIAGCDKSFRKESGLDYHIKYYHSPGGREVKRKRSSASMRSDGTPESSPDVPGQSLSKRRCHRSSAPGQLSCEPSPGVLPQPTQSKPDTITTTTPESLAVTVESPVKSTATQEVELEIEPGTEADALYCGSLDSIEVEEEDVQNGDVIRCRCEEIEEGGFMIQCEQCLTWQHSECVGLTEQTVPSKYLCYVCSNPKGLRRRAKYRNDFDWFRKGTLPSFSFLSQTDENQGYNNQIALSTHDLMADVHSIDSVLKSLRVKLDILRSPNHPALAMWYKPTNKTEVPDIAIKSPATPETENSSVETSLLMVKSDPLSNGLEEPKISLTDHNQNGIENTKISNGTSGLVNGEVTPMPCQRGSLNLTVNSSVNTEGTEEEEATSPLPPLVPVGSTARGTADTTVLNSTKINEKGLNNNTETQKDSLSKDSGVSVLIADDSLGQPAKGSSSSADMSTENNVNKKDDGNSLDAGETADQIAMSNLLDDVAELQESLESRMDIIEQQIQVLEQTQEKCGQDQLDTAKPDLRKLAKDLNRIKRLALHVG